MAECRYCEIVQEKPNMIYEDETLIAAAPAKTATDGHIQVIAKKHHKNIQETDNNELEHLFYTASFAASSLFETLQAHGTNIVANTGSLLKGDSHFHIDVIARKSDDGLNLLWQPKKMSEDEMKEVQNKIKDKCDMIGVQKKNKEVVELDRKPEKLETSEEKPPDKTSEPGGETREKLPSEEEQRYKKSPKGGKKKEDTEEDKESYLVKQLRRLP
ncbi:HIT family protein [Candidatus Woesearchaeota archaeon]|nr:HIT family protein [Candidatus Woesearchaeota archaeon]